MKKFLLTLSITLIFITNLFAGGDGKTIYTTQEAISRSFISEKNALAIVSESYEILKPTYTVIQGNGNFNKQINFEVATVSAVSLDMQNAFSINDGDKITLPEGIGYSVTAQLGRYVNPLIKVEAPGSILIIVEGYTK